MLFSFCFYAAGHEIPVKKSQAGNTGMQLKFTSVYAVPYFAISPCRAPQKLYKIIPFNEPDPIPSPELSGSRITQICSPCVCRKLRELDNCQEKVRLTEYRYGGTRAWCGNLEMATNNAEKSELEREKTL